MNKEISADETFGLRQGYRLRGNGTGPQIVVTPGNPTARGTMSMHQGGVVQTPAGEWWGFSMMDANSIGRLTALVPGHMEGRLAVLRPAGQSRAHAADVGEAESRDAAARRAAPYVRSDEFSGPRLANVWQWNHVPDDMKWSLGRAPRVSAPAFAAGPRLLVGAQHADAARGRPPIVGDDDARRCGHAPGDVAGLALLNRPYAWIGVRRTADGLSLAAVRSDRRLHGRGAAAAARACGCASSATSSPSRRTSPTAPTARSWTPLGRRFTMAFQLKTFQGVRYALFHHNTAARRAASPTSI